MTSGTFSSSFAVIVAVIVGLAGAGTFLQMCTNTQQAEAASHPLAVTTFPARVSKPPKLSKLSPQAEALSSS